jgi:ribosomal protein S18 acetylase RimI-like enzyme
MKQDNMIDTQIRPAIATDLPNLMSLDHSCNSDYVWQLDLQKDLGQVSAILRQVRLPRAIRVEYPRDPNLLADEWGHSAGMLVAASGDMLAGYACLTEQPASAVAWVTDLVVAPGLRRQGIGSALVLEVQTWALERGDRRVILEMQSKNEAAIRLAQKLGYDFCGYNDQYYATQDVALFFGRALK